MNLIEIFESINGEGFYQGYPSIFIRFAGCNLRCSYCDTVYSYEEGVEITLEEIISQVKESSIKRVTITGGEPLLQRDLPLLCSRLIEDGYLIEIETNGSVDVKCIPDHENICVTMDWKLPVSGMSDQMNRLNMLSLRKKDVVKFVVGNTGDLYEAKKILEQYKPKCKVFFSPIFSSIEPKQIVNFILEHKLNDCRVQLQIHKFIWEPQTRGV